MTTPDRGMQPTQKEQRTSDAELLVQAADWLHEYAKQDGPRDPRMGDWVDAIDRAAKEAADE